jgi:putative iron-only hydrogenase system regulator
MNTDEQQRIAVISIVVRDRSMAGRINEVLSIHSESVRGRLGVPFREKGISIIMILLESDSAQIGAITGALGNLPGVTLRSTMLT